jgi:uncharacterized protein (TIGR00251 family)
MRRAFSIRGASLIEETIRKRGDFTLIDLIVSAGSKRDEISGIDRWRKKLSVKIREKPIDGRANSSIIEHLSKVLNVPSHHVKIISGQKSNQKTLEVRMDFREVKARLERLLTEDPGRA